MILSLFFFGVLLLCLAFLSLANAKRLEKGIDISNKAGLSVIASVILGWILIQISVPSGAFPFSVFVLGLYPFLLVAAGLSMYAISSGKIARFWFYLLATSISVVFLPNDLLVFQGLLPLFFDRVFCAVLWALFISGYAKMDKIDNLTITQTTALCLAFCMFPLFSASNNQLTYDYAFSYFPIFILPALIGFMISKKHFPELRLGKTGAIPLGYLMGLFFVLLSAKGYWLSVFVMPAYYYFEIIYSEIYRYFHKKNPQPSVFNFFLSQVIQKNLNTKGIMAKLMLYMLGFALAPILFKNNAPFVLMITGALFFALIYRLLSWGKPKITYKSIFVDTKDVIGIAYQNAKASVKSVKDTLNKK
ncbi:MAG: hypothetical protein E7013_04875 [Alphaproteobacteria bacterium]|nr:hypothetical protein [Alphaproteobacteria bacterium]